MEGPLALNTGRDYLIDLYNHIIERDIIQAYNIKLKSDLKEVFRYIKIREFSNWHFNL